MGKLNLSKYPIEEEDRKSLTEDYHYTVEFYAGYNGYKEMNIYSHGTGNVIYKFDKLEDELKETIRANEKIIDENLSVSLEEHHKTWNMAYPYCTRTIETVDKVTSNFVNKKIYENELCKNTLNEIHKLLPLWEEWKSSDRKEKVQRFEILAVN